MVVLDARYVVTALSVYNKTCLKRTCCKADKIFCPKISVYWSKSHKHNLSKADTSLKRTKILVPKVSALDKFHCTSNLLQKYKKIHYFQQGDPTLRFLCFNINDQGSNTRPLVLHIKTKGIRMSGRFYRLYSLKNVAKLDLKGGVSSKHQSHPCFGNSVFRC